jgi:hypothetical protein
VGAYVPAPLQNRSPPGGRVTSIPDAAEVAIEALPGSTIADELHGAGYDVHSADSAKGQRIDVGAICIRRDAKDSPEY